MSTVAVSPDVSSFLDTVRTHLADLDPEEQREILDGLEADLGELVAERGPDALGDPAAYAAELRQAAGLAAPAEPKRSVASVRAGVTGFLDAGHGLVDRALDRGPAPLRDGLVWARPLWWVLRAWIAVELVDLFHHGQPYTTSLRVVPDLGGFGWALLAVAVVISVQIGRNRIWPGDGSRGLVARLVLLVLNLFAIGYAPFVLQLVGDHTGVVYSHGFDRGYVQGQADADRAAGPTDLAGLYADGKWISQIYPYDAQGHPLVGVQLFNQIGQPINVLTQPEYASDDTSQLDPETGEQLTRIYYPWSNGAAELYNVFPLPSRLQQSEELSPTAFSDKDRPAVGAFPGVAVPRVSLPGITTGARK